MKPERASPSRLLKKVAGRPRRRKLKLTLHGESTSCAQTWRMLQLAQDLFQQPARGFALAGVLILAGLTAQAQETVFKVDVNLVRLLATVKDANGALIGDLSKEEFQVFDNGVPQEITLFERQTSQPLSVALLVDTSGSTAIKLNEETASVMRFLQAFFQEGNPLDAVSLYSFSHDVMLESSFTRRLRRLEKELKGLKGEAGTSLYDALVFAARALEDREGRRVIVVVTDGADTTSVKSFQQALEAVHLADAVIYGIMIIPVTNDPGRNIAGENALITLSTGTGGRVISSTLGDMLDAAFQTILRDLRTQYLIGYYPKNIPYAKDRFHRVRVTLSRPNLRVLTRSGYYGQEREPVPSGPESAGPHPQR